MTLSIMPVYETDDGTTLPQPLVAQFGPVYHGPMLEAAEETAPADTEGLRKMLVPLAFVAAGMWIFLRADMRRESRL